MPRGGKSLVSNRSCPILNYSLWLRPIDLKKDTWSSWRRIRARKGRKEGDPSGGGVSPVHLDLAKKEERYHSFLILSLELLQTHIAT